MEALGNVFYTPGEPQNWSGRHDGDAAEYYRWHQVITHINLADPLSELKGSYVLLGFCCDEGVRRNQGRIGAKDAPAIMRKILGNLPDHRPEGIQIVDAGDVICVSEDLEGAQHELSKRVAQILEHGGIPVVIGGGHEVTYAHFNGLKRYSMSKKIGVINLDAHLDIRETSHDQGNSGTGFYQILEESRKEGNSIKYLALGIQKISNTRALFQAAESYGVEIIPAEEIHALNLETVRNQIIEFSKKVDHIYVTVDMDFFSSAFAPGVSATAFNGIIPDPTFHTLYQTILELPNFECIDFAEINPLFDVDNRTTKLAADLIFRLINTSR